MKLPEESVEWLGKIGFVLETPLSTNPSLPRQVQGWMMMMTLLLAVLFITVLGKERKLKITPEEIQNLMHNVLSLPEGAIALSSIPELAELETSGEIPRVKVRATALILSSPSGSANFPWLSTLINAVARTLTR